MDEIWLLLSFAFLFLYFSEESERMSGVWELEAAAVESTGSSKEGIYNTGSMG